MDDAVRASYDRVAEEYTRRIADELDGKPFDRLLLERFAARLRGAGPVWELGCGPGHVAAFLRERGLPMTGVDLSTQMLSQARRRFPDLALVGADMRRLPLASGSLAGIAAMYSIVHTPLPQLLPLLREFYRVLCPGAPLLLAFHLGSTSVHLDEWWEQPVSLDFQFFLGRDVSDSLLAAGFALEEHHERAPYPGVEHASRRAYVLAARA
jgi:ubiquinone/menaquinone biosynthesis C-methylase UbiE